MENKRMIPFHIERGLNTSYISSLLISLFYRYELNTFNLLIQRPQKPCGYYLQELIKTLFVEPIRKNFSIKSDILNELRNYMIIIGWENDLRYLENRDCCDLFKFLSTILYENEIEFEIYHIKDGIINNGIINNGIINNGIINGIINNTENLLKMKTIDIHLTKDEPTTIKKLFIEWLHDNILKNNNLYVLDCYKLKSIPNFIIFNIIRNENTQKTEIDIKKKIKFFHNSDSKQNYLVWRIHGLICKSNNRYYSVFLSNNNSWIEFDEDKFPCCNYIYMDDDDTIDKIKQDVQMIIYTSNNN